MQLPLIFSFKEPVLGNGFLAGVSVCGRALLEEDSNGVWITGVVPAGIAGGGADRTAAYTKFRTAWAETLFDIAYEAKSFDQFKAEAEAFLGASVARLTEDWQKALAAVRANAYSDPHLPKQSPESQPIRFEVVELVAQHDGAKRNTVEAGILAAA